ncbi:nuclear transport factor 2 family protein [Mycobacterium ahvazicum]|uniref:Nuclear transport factor 2 family protein n=1 Tax=Mycobacterium ahvazicum TaxID=1964395 RepID=A0A2K4YC49_9MYCO|nr:nuclear transport factor 2 family protein [Mycobacterium ahvazicum]SOX54346.1 nuclear transport factor 2 family protein [Mycobacterium ahvazicum]
MHVDLHDRLVKIEDERAIERLIASYGPLVDSAEAEATARLWAVEGSYEVEGWQMRCREDVAAMVRSEQHQNLVNRGCCHFLGPAVVTLRGDRAVAVCESILIVHTGERFAVMRAGANHFRLRRIDNRWQITQRVTKAVDGTAEPRTLLASGVMGE